METKICPKCKIECLTQHFQKNKSAKDGLQYHCKTCRSDIDNRESKRHSDKLRYHTNKNKYRDKYFKRTYNISLEEYNKIKTKQNEVCAICNTTCSTGRNLAVDHCHTTGQIRGLLCQACNQALGLFKENPTILTSALNYLKENDE